MHKPHAKVFILRIEAPLSTCECQLPLCNENDNDISYFSKICVRIFISNLIFFCNSLFLKKASQGIAIKILLFDYKLSTFLSLLQSK